MILHDDGRSVDQQKKTINNLQEQKLIKRTYKFVINNQLTLFADICGAISNAAVECSTSAAIF